MIRYAKVDGPPDNWASLVVYNHDRDELVNHVVAVSTRQPAWHWAEVIETDERGDFEVCWNCQQIRHGRVYGRLEIVEIGTPRHAMLIQKWAGANARRSAELEDRINKISGSRRVYR